MSGRGRFITLEGGEAVGKSTLAKSLKERLEQQGRRVMLTREPGGSAGAELLRGMLLSPPTGVEWTPLCEALLFSAARANHLEHAIRPAIDKGVWVLCDRFADSTRAYQTAGHPEMAHAVLELERLTVGATRPDLTLILDLPYEAAMQRLKARGAPPDAIEGRAPHYHEAVRATFLAIAQEDPRRCLVLDADTAPDALAEAAMTAVERRLGN